MNFNITRTKDYKLNHSMIDEVIRLYGVLVKLLLVEKINSDDLVFGDFSHINTDNNKSFDVYSLPETSETWDNVGINFTEFGMLSLETVNLFFSRKTIDKIFADFDGGRGFEGILGNLIILPNNRIVEITDVQFEVPGGSNLYTNNDTKNVYKFTCKTYSSKLTDEKPQKTISAINEPDYDGLDNYFAELVQEKDDVDNEAEIVNDVQVNKPVVATDEDSVFGGF